eukprot:m.206641 g.206641  ORF g.206641 m.206641 type:complete len:680 (-) comp15536_c29_seq1:240-2279(-)
MADAVGQRACEILEHGPAPVLKLLHKGIVVRAVALVVAQRRVGLAHAHQHPEHRHLLVLGAPHRQDQRRPAPLAARVDRRPGCHQRHHHQRLLALDGQPQRRVAVVVLLVQVAGALVCGVLGPRLALQLDGFVEQPHTAPDVAGPARCRQRRCALKVACCRRRPALQQPQRQRTAVVALVAVDRVEEQRPAQRVCLVDIDLLALRLIRVPDLHGRIDVPAPHQLHQQAAPGDGADLALCCQPTEGLRGLGRRQLGLVAHKELHPLPHLQRVDTRSRQQRRVGAGRVGRVEDAGRVAVAALAQRLQHGLPDVQPAALDDQHKAVVRQRPARRHRRHDRRVGAQKDQPARGVKALGQQRAQQHGAALRVLCVDEPVLDGQPVRHLGVGDQPVCHRRPQVPPQANVKDTLRRILGRVAQRPRVEIRAKGTQHAAAGLQVGPALAVQHVDQRRHPVRAVHVHVDLARLEQGLGRAVVPKDQRLVQRQPPVGRGQRRVCPGVDEGFEGVGAALLCGQQQRCRPVAVGHVGIRSLVDEGSDDGREVLECGQVQQRARHKQPRRCSRGRVVCLDLAGIVVAREDEGGVGLLGNVRELLGVWCLGKGEEWPLVDAASRQASDVIFLGKVAIGCHAQAFQQPHVCINRQPSWRWRRLCACGDVGAVRRHNASLAFERQNLTVLPSGHP